MCDFETRVLPVVTEFANLRFKDESRAQDAIGLCWVHYQRTEKREDVPAKSFAWYAILHTLAGRQLPGMKSRGEDALDYAWRCSTMAYARDKRPGPERVAEQREEWELLVSRLNARQKAFLDASALAMSNQEMARLLGVTPGRVSQMRREIQSLAKE